MTGSVWEALLDVRKWLGDPPGCPGVGWRPSQMSEYGRDALPNVRKLSEGPLKVLKAIPDVWVWSGHLSGCR